MIRVSEDEITIQGVKTDKIDLTGAPQKRINIVDCMTKGKIIFGYTAEQGKGSRVF